MKKRILNFLVTSFLLVNISFCQKIVPVFQEPRHNPVLFNKYLRVIEAQIENSDSSLFHVHAAPSAFVFLTDVVYDNQVLNQGWTKATSKKGHAWYSSFSSGPSTHRVAAPADGRIHAYDVSQPDTRVKLEMEETDYGYIRPGYGCIIQMKEGEKASLVLFEVR